MGIERGPGRLAIAGIGMLGVLACSGEPSELAHETAAIAGGVDDTIDVAVVGIVDDATGATCTGALIAPDLILTAQHCVAPVLNIGPCTQGSFGAPHPATDLFVTTKPMIGFNPSDFHGAVEIRLPPGTGFCNRDVALLRLGARIAPVEARPIGPRLAPPPAAGEIYAAVGYGGTDNDGTGRDTRRRRDGLAVACTGAGCASTFTGDGEWQGETGICGGDSGGPALAGDGRVIGVASRGAVGCTNPVYNTIAEHAGWLVDEAVRAATMGGYPPPPWTGAGPMLDAGVDAAAQLDAPPGPDAGSDVDPDDGGCCSTGGGAPATATLAVLVLALAARPRRRRAIDV